MNQHTALLRVAAAAMLLAASATRLGAQGTGAPPAPPAPPSPPAAAPKLIVPASAMVPADSAVALCNNGTWIYEPGTATDCEQRGGLVVAMPRRASAPPVMAVAARAAVMAPAKVTAAPPAGSTMQCKDGTFLFGAPTADRCAGNGGAAAIFTRPTPAPRPPSRP